MMGATMVRPPPTRSSLIILAALLVAVIAWTWLTLGTSVLTRLDQTLASPRLDPTSATAQVAGAFALLTWPGLEYLALAALAGWAFQHRLRQLAAALVLVIVLGWGGVDLAKVIIRRPRPEAALDLLTAHGFAYPSGHMTGVVACSVAVGAAFAVTRQSVRARIAWQVGASALVLAVAINRWILGAHFFSDIVGGALYGGLVATAALLIAGVKMPVPHEIVTEIVRSRSPAETDETPAKRAAVIFNPSKVTDWITFRRHVEYELKTRGWDRALWLETTPEDPGRAMTETAVEAKVDLVIGAGGDGTIRVICAGLAGTGIPFGLIPAGTGNLLARNIGIPLDESAALDVAFDGVDKPIDLVSLAVDGGRPDYFAVMAGIGIDAVIMESTNPDLKKAVGSAAYFVAAARNANHPALHTTIRVDDNQPLRRKAHIIVVGNVGFLQANIPLLPDAKPDDGLLDVLVASPRTARDWVRITTQVLSRRKKSDSQLDRITGRKVTITVEERDHYQLDGDTVGEANELVAEVHPGALLLRVPRTIGLARRTGANGSASAPAIAHADAESAEAAAADERKLSPVAD
jgi:diacylglycerol kinase (ATP)